VVRVTAGQSKVGGDQVGGMLSKVRVEGDGCDDRHGKQVLYEVKDAEKDGPHTYVTAETASILARPPP